MDIEQICKNLHKINFNSTNGIVRPQKAQKNAEEYNFGKLIRPTRPDGYKDWVKCCHDYPEGKCYCTECESVKNLVQEGIKERCQFTSITHGSHTLDFLDAHDVKHDYVNGWSDKPVLFVFENPGPLDANYGDDGFNKPTKLPEDGGRLPCNWWYFINGQDSCKNEDFIYPNWFVQKEYGWMIYSVIRTFNIANAYVTNMVKCGIGNLNSYLTTDKYNPDIVKKCIETHLQREINALRGGDSDKQVTIFAFGQNVYDKLDQFKWILGKCDIHILPHPANRLANDYRKYVLFGKILRGLLQTDFYKDVSKPDFYDILSNDKKVSEQPVILSKKTLLDYLVTYTQQKSDFKKSATYISNKFTYQITSDTYGLQVIFRHSSDKKADYTVSWACYYPEIGEIYLYKGKDKDAKSAKVFVDCGHSEYEVYNQIVEFVKDLKVQIPALKDCDTVTELDER